MQNASMIQMGTWTVSYKIYFICLSMILVVALKVRNHRNETVFIVSLTKTDLRTLQSSPSQPGRQSHVYWEHMFRHVPPFLQGKLLHKSTSEVKMIQEFFFQIALNSKFTTLIEVWFPLVQSAKFKLMISCPSRCKFVNTVCWVLSWALWWKN